MAAVALLIRSALRRRWRTLVVLSLITALASGFILTAAMGARRTHTAWDRLNERTDAPDVLISVGPGDVGAVSASIAARADVAGSGAFSWIPAAVEGMPGAEQQGLYAGLGPGFASAVWRPLIERGRHPDPARRDEVTVNQSYADLAGVDVGDVVRLVGPGIDQQATVVGIHRSPLDIGPNGGAASALATPAFTARWWPVLSTIDGFEELRPAIGVRFADGTDVEAVLQDLAHVLPSDAGIVGPGSLDSDVRDGLNAGATAYWILAASTALGSALLLSFLFVRAMRLLGDDPELLAALGATRLESAVATWVPFALAIAAGVVVAPVLATIASPIVRTGFAKVADPVTGVWVDVVGLVGLAAVLGLTLLAVAAVGAWRVSSRRRPVVAALRSPSAFPRLGGSSPAAIVGACSAFGGIGPSGRRLARSTLLGVGGAMACAIGAFAWMSSASHLERDHALQGWAFDAVAMSTASTTDATFDAASDALLRSDEVTRFARIEQVAVPYRGVDIDLFSVAGVREAIVPTLLRGRAPSGPNEVVVGQQLMRDDGLDLGDDLVLTGPAGAVRSAIVGEIIFPFLGNTGFGYSVVMTPDTMEQLGTGFQNRGFLLDVAPGTDLGELQQAVGSAVTMSPPSSPPAIIRLHDAWGVNGVVAAFFAVVAFAILALGLVTTEWRQRREYAVLRSMGFRRQQVVAAFVWQSGLTLLVAALVAMPVGIAIGRVLWTLTSRNLGVLDAFAVPIADLALAALTAAVVATVIALLAALRPCRSTAAAGLRTE